jgi:hypothetical protein
MVGLPTNSGRPSPGSILHGWLAGRTQPGSTFDCGVRVLEGRIAKESGRWRHRASSADPLIVDGVVTLYHGTAATLRLRLDASPRMDLGGAGAGVPSGHVVLSAQETVTGAHVLLSVAIGEVGRFGFQEK